jgi:hypothetical protein
MPPSVRPRRPSARAAAAADGSAASLRESGQTQMPAQLAVRTCDQGHTRRDYMSTWAGRPGKCGPSGLLCSIDLVALKVPAQSSAQRVRFALSVTALLASGCRLIMFAC